MLLGELRQQLPSQVLPTETLPHMKRPLRPLCPAHVIWGSYNIGLGSGHSVQRDITFTCRHRILHSICLDSWRLTQKYTLGRVAWFINKHTKACYNWNLQHFCFMNKKNLKNLVLVLWIKINSCALSLRSCTGVIQASVDYLMSVPSSNCWSWLKQLSFFFPAFSCGTFAERISIFLAHQT